jgi:hypothetical protein
MRNDILEWHRGQLSAAQKIVTDLRKTFFEDIEVLKPLDDAFYALNRADHKIIIMASRESCKCKGEKCHEHG